MQSVHESVADCGFDFSNISHKVFNAVFDNQDGFFVLRFRVDVDGVISRHDDRI